MASEWIKPFKRIIEEGGIVGVPTETVYGLAVNALDYNAVDSLYELKGRPAVKPMAIMVSGIDKAAAYCTDIPSPAYLLAEKYWPGPLTIVLKSNGKVAENVTAGGDTIALRCPDCGLTLQLLRELDVPVAVPSANPSGMEAAVTAEEVIAYFPSGIGGVIDGGPSREGVASTIVSLANSEEGKYSILREGALPPENIEKCLFDSVRLIGITGTTGSGKTTALKIFEEEGIPGIDCDALYHEMLDNNEALLSDIESAFPEAFRGGVLNRKALGDIVFCDPGKLNRLNEITHARVLEEIRKQVVSYALKGKRAVAIDAIALFESGLGGICCKTVSFTADKASRTERITSRDGISADYAGKRVSAQKEDSYYIENSNINIENNGTLEEFKDKVRRCIKEEIFCE